MQPTKRPGMILVTKKDRASLKALTGDLEKLGWKVQRRVRGVLYGIRLMVRVPRGRETECVSKAMKLEHVKHARTMSMEKFAN